MQEKMKILLEQIELDSEFLPYFDNGDLKKIVISKNKDIASFYIHLEHPLPVSVYLDFNDLLTSHFKMEAIINIESDFDEPLFIEYYNYFIDNEFEVSNTYSSIFKESLTVIDKEITLEFSNKAEKTKFSSIEKKLLDRLNSVGFDISINTVINKEKSKAVLDEIEEEKNKSKEIIEELEKSKSAVIYGMDFYSEYIPLNTITEDTAKIDFEAEIITVELNESQNKKTNIVTIGVSDSTAKKICKIFIRDKSRAIKLVNSIVKGNWYKFKAKWYKAKEKDEKYSRGPALVIVSIVETNKPERITKFEEEQKKVVKGRKFDGDSVSLDSVTYEIENIIVEAKLFGLEIKESFKKKIITLKLTDEKDSIYGKIIEYDEEEFTSMNSKMKIGKWYKIRGSVRNDEYLKELVLSVNDMYLIDKKEITIKDEEDEKRVELHTHTKMSQMDGLADEFELVAQAISWGHKGIAITDHNGCQAFPHVFSAVTKHNSKISKEEDKFKVLYGTELSMVEDTVEIIIRPNDSKIKDNIYVVFDVETTGLNAGLKDSIIEIGAVKIKDGEVIDRFNELINPGIKLSKKIVEITAITDEMLKSKPSEEEVIKEFKDWIEDFPLVAHNAKFDSSMLEAAYHKYNLGEFSNPLIDTLELSRTLERDYSKHSLSALVKRYNIPFDEEHHHRADYDAEATAYIFNKMITKLLNIGIHTLSDMNTICKHDETHIFGRTHHINILVLNKTGLKNMFKLISFANTDYIHKNPRIPRRLIEKYREGLLVGASCYESEIFESVCMDYDKKLEKKIKFYDYIEVQPIEVYEHLLWTDEINSIEQLEFAIKRIIDSSKKMKKIVVATGDVHHIKREDRLYREIIVNQKVPGGGRHPLAKVLDNFRKIPSQHFRTTREMLDDFNFLGDKLAKEIVIDNPNKILDMADIVEVIMQTGGTPFSPKMENSAKITTDLVYSKAHELYGENVPELINTRIEQELKGIIKGGFDVIYLIAEKLVKKSNDDGYFVGSRGSVGSSIVAFLMGISEVNPLPAHYLCPNCKKVILELKGKDLNIDYPSGYDLPDKICECGTKLLKDGQDIPFSTFLGVNADKVPDIDLNFSSEYQSIAHEYTKELFGSSNVFRAGTVGTVADKTAYGFVKGFYEDRGINKRSAEIERLASMCIGVKRTTGQHPGGIVVIPEYMDIFDFCPYQFPADDNQAKWKTTHFEYHSLEDNLLKLDILGHDDPTMLKVLPDLSGIKIEEIPMDDKKVFSLFTSPEALGVTEEQILCPTGTLGLPEIGTNFVIGMLKEARPMTFSELVKISGLSHGTGVWAGNARELLQKGISFKDIIGCREELTTNLVKYGLEASTAFKITEFIRKSYAPQSSKLANPKWLPLKEELNKISNNLPYWFVDSIETIEYMFPKAHATAYCMMGVRVAWYKIYKPVIYYAAYFSIRCFAFDIDVMIKGYNSIRNKIVELNKKGFDKTNKEEDILNTLQLALEMTARGFKFGKIDLYKSHSKNFIIDDDNKTLIPPFRTIDGLGDTVSNNIVEEREKRSFISIEDLQKRAKVSSTLIDKMRVMHMLDGLDESSQLSLF